MAKIQVGVCYTGYSMSSPGVVDEVLRRVYYPADITRLSSRWSSNTESTNDNLSLNSQVSFIADAFALRTFTDIKCVEVYGLKWKVTNVEVQHPRIILTVGGVYNG